MYNITDKKSNIFHKEMEEEFSMKAPVLYYAFLAIFCVIAFSMVGLNHIA